LAQSGKRVLLVDTDPHASLSSYFGLDSEELSGSLFNIFVDNERINKDLVLDALCPSNLDSMFILPAIMALATIERRMENQHGTGLILRNALETIQDEFDYVLIDCPPVLGVMMINALAACERIVVPVQTEFLALKGLQRMMQTMRVMYQTDPTAAKCLIVPTMFDKRVNAAIESYNSLRDTYGENLWAGVIPVDTKIREASQARIPPSVFCPKSRGVYAYKTLLKALLAEGNNGV
jgi:chromosome partitioning protein